MSTHSRRKYNVYSPNTGQPQWLNLKPLSDRFQFTRGIKLRRKKAGVVYKISCSQCEKVYIGETGRQLGTRITEHRKEAEKISDRNFTRSTRRASTNEHHKSAITDHVCQNNHIMNWEASEIVEQESDKFKRWIKESICIRSNTPTMNRDEGVYQLSPLWTQVISTPKPGGASTE